MRKILVIALMVALIPFTTGCRLFGDYDSSGETVGTTGTTVVTSIQPTIVLPAETTDAGIKAKLSLGGALVYIVESDGTTEDACVITTTTTGYTAKPAAAIATTKFTSDGTNYKIKIRIKFANGKSAYCDTYVPVQIAGTTSTATSADNVSITLTLKTDSSGNLTFSYTVTYTAVGATGSSTTTASTYTAPTTTATGTTATTLGAVYVEKITYSGTTETILDAAGTVTNVDFATATFKVYFNTAVSAIPTTYSLSAANGAVTVSFSSTDNSVATASLDSTGKIMSLTVWGQKVAGKMLDPNTTYTVTFTSADVYKSGSTTEKATIAEAGTTYKFTTAKAALASWDAYKTAGTSLKSGTTTVTVASTATTIALTFNYGVTQPTDLLTASTYVFSKTKNSGTAATGIFKDYISAASLDTTKKILTLTLKKALTAGTYVITYSSGSFTDINSKAIDTTTSTTFTVN